MAASVLGGCSAPADDDRAAAPPRESPRDATQVPPENAPQVPPQVEPPAFESYEGPPLRCALEVMESEPPQYAVPVETTVPTGGYEMALERVAWHGDVADVEIKITVPGADEVVTHAAATHRVRAVLPRRPKSCRVLVALWTRGAHYLVAPEYVLAAVVPAQGAGTGR